MLALSDAECLEAFVRGRDENAFRQLVERYGRIVYSAARRQAPDEQSAEDVTQAVFIVLIRKAAGVKPQNLAGWLIKTTYLVARQARRTEARRIRRQTIAASIGATMNEQTPESDADWREIAPLLDKAIWRLSEQDRNVVCMRFLHDKPISEVAAAMGISEPAAAKRVERALARLRRDFAARGVTVAAAVIAATLSARGAEACPPGLVEAVAAKALAAAHGAAAASSASLLAKGIILMATAKKTALAAAIVLLLLTSGAAVFVGITYFGNSNDTAAAPDAHGGAPIAADTATPGSPAGSNRIKVGILLSDYTANGPHWISTRYGWKDQLIPVRALRDSSIEVIPVVEPGTAANPELARILSTNFPRKTPIDASNAQDLEKLDVLVAQAAHNVPWNVQQAVLQAVHDGLGFLNRGFMTVTPGYTPLYSSLSGVDNVCYGWSNNYDPLKCEIVGDHPLLGDLAGQTGKTIMIELAGPVGVARGIPLIRVSDMQNVTTHGGIKAVAGQYMYPFLLSQYGRGRIMVFAFAHYQVPAALDKANHGRFYVHCVQWLAGKPLN
ncbi:MAG: sigma-70 family RNA polymerase sigma factor [Tepidisphaeraceae bacterium]|jgi:RNA polymerase sigma factor (sigma-70 family)